MPRTTHCPECSHTFRIPDNMAFRPVKCPACEHRFAAIVEEFAIPASEERSGAAEASAPPETAPAADAGEPPPAPAVHAAEEEPAAAPPPAEAVWEQKEPSPLPPPTANGKPATVPPPPGPRAGPAALAGVAVVLGALGSVLGGLQVLGPGGMAAAGLGLLLAVVALGWASLGRRRGAGLALASVVVCGQGLALALLPPVLGERPGPAPAPPRPPEPERPVPALLQAMSDQQPEARANAVAQVSGGVLAALPDLADLLTDADPAVRTAAANALGALGPSARGSIPALLHTEKEDHDREVQRAARAALDRIGRYPTVADVPQLLAGLQAPHSPRFRAAAAQVLWMVGTARRPEDWPPEERAALRAAAPGLTAALRDRDGTVRLYAAEALLAVERQPQLVLPTLRDALQEPEAAVRTEAAKVLAGLGREAALEAVPQIREALERETDGGARLALARALWVLDGKTEVLVDVLLQALQDPDRSRRETAADVLGQAGDRLGAQADRLVPPLVAILEKDEALLRVRAAYALGRLGPDVGKPGATALAARLRDGDPEVRRYAAAALIRLGPSAAPAVPALLEALRHKDPVVRVRSAAALGAAGDGTAEVVAALARALRHDPDATVRSSAAVALGKLGRAAVAAVDDLSAALKDSDRSVRGYAAEALLSVGPRAATALLTLMDLLGSKGPEERLFAARALGKIGREAKVACKALHEAGAAEPDDAVRQALDEALTKVGYPTAADLDLLLEALKGDNIPYRVAAAEVVGMLAEVPATAVPALHDALRTDNVPLRTAAAVALGKARQDAAVAVPDLARALTSEDVGLRLAAATALGSVGEAAKDAVGPLQTALGDADARVRAAAAFALGSIGPKAKAALKAVIDRLGDSDLKARVGAAFAVGRIEPHEAGKAITVLRALLVDEKEDAEVRVLAASALGAMGVPNREVREALQKVLQDRNDKVREAAADALKELGP
jgi:HEAT repeat protein